MKANKIVYICSPLKGDVQKNIAKANYYARFAYEKGCIPLAPHTVFTQFLNDDNPKERERGKAMGLKLLDICAELWVFGDHISKGMSIEIEKARRKSQPIRWFTKNCKEVFDHA